MTGSAYKSYAACLTKRGLRYNDEACNILWGRNHKLITAWYWERDVDPRSERVQRLWDITSRIKLILDALKCEYIVQQLLKEQDERLLANSIVALSCHRFRCHSDGMIVLFKNYKPGELKCTCCGRPLQTDEERQLEYELLDMGFYSE